MDVADIARTYVTSSSRKFTASARASRKQSSLGGFGPGEMFFDGYDLRA